MQNFNFKFPRKTALAILISSMTYSINVNSQSLEQAVAYTLDTHPELRVAFSKFKVSDKQVDQAKSGYWPTVDLTGGIGAEYTDSPSTRRSVGDDAETLTRSELGISLKQNLFQGFHTTSEVDRTSFTASAEQWRLYSDAEDLALQIIKVYIDLIKTEKLVGLSEKNLDEHERIYEQIKERTDSGLGSTADLSQINGRLAKANSNLIAAKNNYLDSKVQFLSVVAQAPEDLVIPIPDADMLPETEDEGVQQALDHHPVIKSSSNDISAALYQYEAAKSTYYPEITIELSANFNDNLDGEDGSFGDVGGENNDAQAMLRFRYNLFSGGRDVAYATETAYKITEAKELNANVHRQVTEGFILSWNAFEQLNQQKKYIKMHVIASKDTQFMYQEQFKLGQRSLLDLLDTENELYQARTDFLEAEFTEITAQYRILHSTGLLLDSLRVTRPETWSGEENYEGGVN
ncbi:TolC family outer membrane protein [Psychromonas sp. Urea-02u-13]|uniref:TolC family outer membrane protein n=1 Tax=Psychromonas sp. Urea-02u-13 TaxID=2058326 RepID=UPI000C33DE57|nr:TolC family outer membrane protein [Psychromonas sp. Urea-02u-13]PKG40315.1 channel protein TolC [Psychromonas sp. Urea-02u-13]